MAGEIIRPKDLTPRPSPVASELMVVDNSVTVGAATIKAIVEAGRPAASQAEAQAGTNPEKAMTPLTTKQSIAAEVGVTVASKAQGDLAATAVQPSGLSAVATTGAYADLSGKPVLGTAAATDATAYATATQGGKADTALQSVVPGLNVAIDNTDPRNPIVSASGGAGGRIPSRAWAIDNLHPAAAPESLRTDGYATAGDGGGALYKKVASEPTHAGKFSITLADAVTVVWYEIAETTKNPIMFGAVGDGSNADAAFSGLASALRVGDRIDGVGGNYLITQRVVFATNKITFIGVATVNFTLLSTTGVFNFTGLMAPKFSDDGAWTFRGPEDATSWLASSKTTLYSAIYANACVGAEFENITGNGIRIVINLVGCTKPIVRNFEVNGFTPDMVAPTGPDLPGNFDSSANWIEGVRCTGSADGLFDGLYGDHNGSVIVIGTGVRHTIRKVYGTHMHDNLVYVSSADYTNVSDVRGGYINGSAVKCRGSHNRVTDVFADRVGIGVTISPYNDSGTLPGSKKAGSNVVVDGVAVSNSVLGVIADTFDVAGDPGFLENVTITNVRLQNMLGGTSSIPIRVATSGNAYVTNFDIIGHAADYGVRVYGALATETGAAENCVIRDGTVQSGPAVADMFNVRNFSMENIRFAGITQLNAVRATIAWDGVIRNCRGDDSSKRIIATNNCNRTSIRDNTMFAADAATLEVFGNATNGLKNIGTTAPYKAGQFALTSAGGVAVSKGATATTDWVAI